jgi:hypothetical protein
MNIVEKMLEKDWRHDADEDRIEALALDIRDPSLLSKFALRFISGKGLSGEFADALEQILDVDPDLDHLKADGHDL